MHTLRAITSTRPGSRPHANRRATILRKAALAGAAATVHASVKASAVNPDAWYGPADEAYLPLTAAGAVTLTFNLTSPGKKVLTFSAVCACSGLCVSDIGELAPMTDREVRAILTSHRAMYPLARHENHLVAGLLSAPQ